MARNNTIPDAEDQRGLRNSNSLALWQGVGVGMGQRGERDHCKNTCIGHSWHKAMSDTAFGECRGSLIAIPGNSKRVVAMASNMQ